MINKILFFVIFSLFLSCYNNTKNLNTKSIQDYPDNFITNPKITIYKKNKLSLETTSDLLIKNESEDTKLKNNVTATFYNELGIKTSVLNSDSAFINEIDNSFNAFGNVKVVSDSGFILSTNSIYWDRNYNKVISNDSIRFTTEKNDTLYGLGFESDTDLSNWKILKPSGVTYRIK
ncbi:MAG: LPS export ABC transporter periplasmic protein LptC [Candidatus Marinimicrobia bacterium]|nr:LPS export ABC transporter periplasmic protein LptC [Candidatus Neomarinimicrobiota bacterium]|tara:strand:+ start:6510 stop:7037 length:528 start_codon:yes stop_codon:yes gene_type:complete